MKDARGNPAEDHEQEIVSSGEARADRVGGMPVVSLSMARGAPNKEVADELIRELGGRSLYDDVVEGVSRRTRMPLERIKGVIEDRPSFFDRWIWGAVGESISWSYCGVT